MDIDYEVEVNIGAGPVNLWLPVPQSNANQRIEQLRFSGVVKHTLHTRDGNRYYFAKVPAGGKIGMHFRATRSERIAAVESGLSDRGSPNCCLGPDRLVPIDGQIRKWAQEVVGPAATPVAKARAIYEHVIDTVKYDKSGKGWGRGDIYYACDERRGNCSDFHAIFIGYARASGIPAQFTIGFPLPPQRGEGEIAGYHCWAEFWASGPGWIPIDASEAAKDPSRRKFFFGALDEHRIEFTKGRDLILEPRQAGEPLNFFVYPYAERDGQPVKDLRTRIRYRDAAER